MINLENLERIDTISADDFLAKYKTPELPVVMEQLTKDWAATQRWSLEYFEKLGAGIEVELYNTTPSVDTKHQYAVDTKLPLKEYFNRLRKGEKDLRMFFFQVLKKMPQLQKDFSYPDLGLHFFQKLPVMFLGGKGAKVQMHFDIDYADIILCHFGGEKRVMLFSQEQTKYMYHVPFSFSALFNVDFRNPDYEKYPALKQLKGYETTLKHGDALYIPPGWWHYIEYDEISYSLALRAFSRRAKNFFKMLNNLLLTRTFEGMMRKFVGQKWNDRNMRVAYERTNKRVECL